MSLTRLSPAALALATVSVLPLPAAAQTVLSGDHSVDGFLCVGNECTNAETFGAFDDLKIKGDGIGLLFEDTGGTSTNDWRIQANATGEDSLFITDVTGGTTPFKVLGTAPDNSLYVASDGDVGLGTSMPEAALHIETTSTEGILINRTNTSAGAQAWETYVSNLGSYAIRDVTGDALSMLIQRGTPEGSLFFQSARAIFNALNEDYDFAVRSQTIGAPLIFGDASTERVGMGTLEPDGKLHTVGDGVQLIYFESGDGGPVQVRFRTDSENRRFLATNNADEVQSQVIFKNDEILFTGTTDRGADRWMSISQAGLVTQGPSCNPGPCDRTFDPSYFTVPPIEDRAAMMWEQMHLPAIGPTNPDTPVNLTEKMGGVIHELEVAHIYIAQQQERIADLEARLAALEAR